jgi:site-specific recombinase XerC
VGERLPGLTPHGLRHSFASVAEDLGFTIPTIKALLGHTGSGVTEGYIHKVDSALIAAADRVATHIAGMMDLAGPGEKQAEPGQVVQTSRLAERQ